MKPLKTCSKCKKDYVRIRFVKDPKYFDGYHPWCFHCRKRGRESWLAKQVNCTRCKSKPRTARHHLCTDCERETNGNPNAKRRPNYDRTNKTLCCRCKSAPRCEDHGYCRDCRRKSVREWLTRKGGSWAWANTTPERREKHLARVAVHTAVTRGNLKRMVCGVCGDPKTEAHHFMGYSKENRLKVHWLCKIHHDEAERIEKSYLTDQPLLL